MSDEQNRPTFMSEPMGSSSGPNSLIEVPELVRQALESKLQAIGGYDAILWKIRSGYLAVLYGSLALILGTSGVPNLHVLAADLARSVAAISLILGFSVAAFLVDFGYLRKKLKVIVARDELLRLALSPGPDKEAKLRFLLQISGEAPLPDPKIFGCARREYKRQRNWNLWWITLWLYFITPVIALFVWAVARGTTAS